MQTPRHRPVYFLLVEDDDDHAELVMRALNENRIVNRLDRLADGESALRFLKGEPPHENRDRPDVILLDIKLPGIDGLDVLAAIKSDESLRSIPVVMLTTSQAESDRARAYSSYANSYLVKPLDFDRFSEMIQSLEMYWAVWNVSPVTAAAA